MTKKLTFLFALILSTLTVSANDIEVIRGDVNGDGKVDMDDATFVTNIILGTETATKAADVNNDGTVNMPDVMFVVNYIIGTPADTFNAEAADANLNGEIGMPDVMFIVQYILNGKFPDEETKERPIVISKIYSSGSKYNGNQNYMAGRYIELYNQSDEAANLAGMYIGLLESTGNANRVYTLEELENDPGINGSMVVVKQVFRIPTDKQYILEGGKSLLITNSAIDHSYVSDFEADLTNADFEAVDYNDNLEHNDNVVKLPREFNAISTMKGMNLLQGGPCGIILFETDEDINSWPTTYGYGKTAGSMVYLLVPKSTIKDGVDFIKNTSSGPNLSTKRLYDEIDAGCTHIEAIAGYTGEVVYRRTARITPDGRKILMDTNNSSNDFKVSTTIKPREYDAE